MKLWINEETSVISKSCLTSKSYTLFYKFYDKDFIALLKLRHINLDSEVNLHHNIQLIISEQLWREPGRLYLVCLDGDNRE